MKKVTCHLKSASPYSQGRQVEEKKDRNEDYEAFEARTWKKRLHINKDGNIYIPPMAFKNCLSEAAKYKSIKIPGKGNSTFTKHFEAGLMVLEPLVLPVTPDDIDHEWLFVPANGDRGGSKRVNKCFPLIQSWEGKVEFLVFDEIISEEAFTEHIRDAGSYIGIGRFRPRNNGFYGRFSVESMKWS